MHQQSARARASILLKIHGDGGEATAGTDQLDDKLARFGWVHRPDQKRVNAPHPLIRHHCPRRNDHLAHQLTAVDDAGPGWKAVARKAPPAKGL
jgi:hypothetical protein